jgi:PelA/Pel-15E family pectate lyase
MGIKTNKKIRLNFFKTITVFACAFFASLQLFAQNEIIVSQDGKGNFTSIQAALNSLPAEANRTQRVILIKPGIYTEKLFVDKDFITLRGENPKTTIITISLARDDWRCDNKDDYGTAAINLKGNDITLQNLSFTNSYGKDIKTEREIICKAEAGNSKKIRPDGHQMAFRSFKCTRIMVTNCIFTAYGGDTVSPWNTWEGMYYFKDCVMEGGVDFYCPRGWALAENCTFICHNNNAAIWHDGSDVKSSKTVLYNCTFKGDDNFKLGRFHKDAQFYLINCSFPKNMADADIYLVPSKDPKDTLKWGRRVYYYNCKKAGGDFAWFKNNLPADFGINEFNISWVYDYRWNPKWNPTNQKITNSEEVRTVSNKNTYDTIAENMLLYQRSNGGWPKHFKTLNVDYKHTLTSQELKELQADFASSIDATIDNNATTKEIRYLVKAYKKTNDKRYLAAVEKGIDFFLKAQYASNGGWPQYYPDFSSYRSEITYNDNAMINVLNVLADVVEGSNDLNIINPNFKTACANAVKLGIDCILKTQIKQNGILTGWCAQYDAKTLLPAKARAYELPSLSGQETVGIVRFLMRFEKPSTEIKNAINTAVKWLDKVKIVGYSVEEIDAPSTPKGRDRVFVPSPNNVMWARFMDLENNEPFFCGRDGVKKKTLAEVEYERRNGYAWYNKTPAKLIEEEYPIWLKKNK